MSLWPSRGWILAGGTTGTRRTSEGPQRLAVAPKLRSCLYAVAKQVWGVVSAWWHPVGLAVFRKTSGTGILLHLKKCNLLKLEVIVVWGIHYLLILSAV